MARGSPVLNVVALLGAAKAKMASRGKAKATGSLLAMGFLKFGLAISLLR